MTLPAAADPALEPVPARLHWRALLHPGIEALWALALLSSLYFLLCAWDVLPLLPILGQNELTQIEPEERAYARLVFTLFAAICLLDYPFSWLLFHRGERNNIAAGLCLADRYASAQKQRLTLACGALLYSLALLLMLNGVIRFVHRSGF